MSAPKRLARNVIVLGVVSLLTDVAADMVTPFLPLFLTVQLHARGEWVGLVEGVAESTSALVKYLSGALSDRVTRRKPLVLAGYGLANLARPFIALAAAPWHVLLVRFIDRVGKGVRTSPRDAILAASVAPAERGHAFGFHRGMDNLGAVFGPLVATAILWVRHDDLRLVFAATAVPGVAAIAVALLGVKEPAAPEAPQAPAQPTQAERPRDPGDEAATRELLGAMALFALANASDGFLVMRAHDVGIPTRWLPLAWGALSLLRALSASPGGRLADRFGRARCLALAWTLYAVAYALFGLATRPWHLLPALLVYGAYYGLSEGGERALIASLAPAGGMGKAFGRFHLVNGALALPASLLFGALYPHRGGVYAFGVASAFALCASAYLTRASRRSGLT
ncbi:MAG: MFS transporter [Polyangiales bacterium]